MFLELIDFGTSKTQNALDTVVLCHAIVAIAKQVACLSQPCSSLLFFIRQVAISENARKEVLNSKEQTPPLITAARNVIIWISEKVSRNESKLKGQAKESTSSDGALQDPSLRRTRILENLAVEVLTLWKLSVIFNVFPLGDSVPVTCWAVQKASPTAKTEEW